MGGVGNGFDPNITFLEQVDQLFHRDSAVGWSIALVGTISMVVAILILLIGKGAMARRLAEAYRGDY